MAQGPENREHPRVPFESEVRISYSDLSELVKECAANLSLGGMFVRMSNAPPVGTELSFEINIEAEANLLRGKGRVAWVRRSAWSESEQPGIGIEFLEIDEMSKAIIFRIVDQYIQSTGGEPFDLAGAPHGGGT
jgi:uncharacterized protein (TIGR02266 family)